MRSPQRPRREQAAMAAIEQARWMLRLEAIYIEEVDGVCELTPTGEVGAIAAAHYLRIGSRLKEPSPDSELDDRALNTHRIKG